MVGTSNVKFTYHGRMEISTIGEAGNQTIDIAFDNNAVYKRFIEILPRYFPGTQVKPKVHIYESIYYEMYINIILTLMIGESEEGCTSHTKG